MAPDFKEMKGSTSFKRFIRVNRFYKKTGVYNSDWIPTGNNYADAFSMINPQFIGYPNGSQVGTWKATYYCKFKSPNFVTLG